MKLPLLTCLPVIVVLAVPALAEGPPPGMHEVRLNGHVFTLPDGFEIELVAGPPLVNRPIEADFDEEGRLYVSDSSGSNENVQEQLKKKPHRIIRLEDTKGTGKFDKATLFADGLMFPEGVLWYNGSLYVAGAPSIWKLTDTKGTGVADQRSEWFSGKTLTGCANDLHGPYLGPDGWIYWCKGAFAKQTYERPGKPPFVTRAAHIFRCRPDGTGIEPVMTGGMDNPVKVVFTPGGERIFTTTFFQHPANGKRDGLVHAVYGGVYGKDHDVVYEHPWTSPSLMLVLTHMGAAAPCGLIRYESTAFGKMYQDNLFACQFNMHKVSRHVLEPDGATFRTKDSDFLVSNNLDFHPTDVLEDADGSLLVIDTGGWYKLCCPTSQLHKPDVLGAIYRIRRKSAGVVDDPRGRKLDWKGMKTEEVVKLLGDARPAIRHQAIAVLAERGASVVPELAHALKGESSIEGRRNILWTATRLDHPEARALVRSALRDEDETVRQVALHSISLWRDAQAEPVLCEILKRPSLQNRRAAAEALGRIGDRKAVASLLEAAKMPSDRFFEHSLTYALIELDDPKSTAAGLEHGHDTVNCRALIALDQMKNGDLRPQTVALMLGRPWRPLQDAGFWVLGHHPEWGPALVDVLREQLDARRSFIQGEQLIGELAKLASSPAVQALLADRLRDKQASRGSRHIVLQAMALAGLRDAPPAWLDALVDTLARGELLREAVSTARALPAGKQPSRKLTAALRKLSEDTTQPLDLRLQALAAVPGGLQDVPLDLFTILRENLGSDQKVATRGLAAEILSRAKLTRDQLLALTSVIKDVGPLELDRVLDAFGQVNDDAVGEALLKALKTAPARTSLRVGALRPRMAKFGPTVQKHAEELYASIDADQARQQARLEELLGHAKDGDIRRGQQVFNSQKVACSSCHAIGYLGGNVGPDLTHIGKIRSERDLLEAIVFPSASFVRSYEPYQVTTKSGKVYNGLLRKDAPEEVVLVIGANQEVRLARSTIEEIVPSKVSVMPAGLDQQLTVGELADLVAFLKACK